ncbi:transcriptional regulator, MerR family [Corynebacterium efficiens YS-314]|uniref:Putative transcription regulator n=1 Tax=Corynebacterium efficiens (strain DSM 44549 / YS-314 / AJ 12310 / JCM 11189 / NBRC 100395) TaxID=196164 RepID=Q8FNE3_COREF|nr:MerR family transcriptional regulator [Corynebacterium efficiens]EEW49165.1 transcriptional regulator, MerR family [Corynebacterium efficiens YS-314]BAC19011.1 putative transcription regulator [Corynebacterium efficiens YS-314]
MDDNGLKIGEVTELTGLSATTLRHYDSHGLITSSARSPGGFRLYSQDDLRRILLVRRMKPLGFTLDQMREFLDAAEIIQNPDDIPAAERKQAEATLANIREEARNRYEKLLKQLGYAEEFLELVTGLES